MSDRRAPWAHSFFKLGAVALMAALAACTTPTSTSPAAPASSLPGAPAPTTPFYPAPSQPANAQHAPVLVPVPLPPLDWSPEVLNALPFHSDWPVRRSTTSALTSTRVWLEMTRQGLDPKLGLDNHFMDKAKAAGKPAAGLERAQEQIGMLDGMEATEQRQFIVEALDQAEKGSAETERLHQAWRRGDAEGLWSGMAADMKRQYPRLYRRINVERNDAWVPRIQQILTQPGDDDALVVVGALHLLGDDGVVEKLRARGYQVERICSACKAGTR